MTEQETSMIDDFAVILAMVREKSRTVGVKAIFIHEAWDEVTGSWGLTATVEPKEESV
jgi:hypothetical protein